MVLANESDVSRVRSYVRQTLKDAHTELDIRRAWREQFREGILDGEAKFGALEQICQSGLSNQPVALTVSPPTCGGDLFWNQAPSYEQALEEARKKLDLRLAQQGRNEERIQELEVLCAEGDCQTIERP